MAYLTGKGVWQALESGLSDVGGAVETAIEHSTGGDRAR
jgi:hypothetical protein